MKVASIFLFAAASLLLYYGCVMLFIAPGTPGGQYFSSGRVLYGVIPTVLALGLLLLATWLWPVSNVSLIAFGKRFKNILSWTLAGISLFWIFLILLTAIRNNMHRQ